MILHSDREGNDCIWKLQCHCIQILHSDIYSVWSIKTCSRHQNSKASSPRKEFLEPRLGMCIFDFIDPNRSQFYAWFHLAMKYSWLGTIYLYLRNLCLQFCTILSAEFYPNPYWIVRSIVIFDNQWKIGGQKAVHELLDFAWVRFKRYTHKL